MARSRPKVLDAERIVLRDKSGRIRIEISAAMGSSSLRFFDAEMKPRAELVLSDEGVAGLQFSDMDGIPRIIISLDPDDDHTATPAISLNGKDGRGSIVTYISPDRKHSIAFRNNDGKLKYSIPPQSEKENK